MLLRVERKIAGAAVLQIHCNKELTDGELSEMLAEVSADLCREPNQGKQGSTNPTT